MADRVRASDKIEHANTADSITGFNLVDLAGPRHHDVQSHKKQGPPANPDMSTLPAPDVRAAQLTAKSPALNPLLTPDAWQTKPLADIYEGGVFKLLSSPTGKENFGLRVSQEQDDQSRLTNLRGRKLHDRMSLSFEYQYKF